MIPFLARAGLGLPALSLMSQAAARPVSLIGCHLHPAYGMGGRASRDALQVGPDGYKCDIAPLDLWDGGETTLPGSAINLNPTYPSYRD